MPDKVLFKPLELVTKLCIDRWDHSRNKEVNRQTDKISRHSQSCTSGETLILQLKFRPVTKNNLTVLRGKQSGVLAVLYLGYQFSTKITRYRIRKV